MSTSFEVLANFKPETISIQRVHWKDPIYSLDKERKLLSKLSFEVLANFKILFQSFTEQLSMKSKTALLFMDLHAKYLDGILTYESEHYYSPFSNTISYY